MTVTENVFAIIVPCYNESQRLQGEKFLSYAKANPGFDIWFANDGSTDNTLEMLHQTAVRSSGNIKVYDVSPNGGKAEAIRKTMNYLLGLKQYMHIGFIDADLSAPLEEINPLYEVALNRNLLIVAGARVKLVGKTIFRSPVRHYLGRVFATYYDTLLKLRNYDTQCGLKIFDVHIAQKIFTEPFVSNWFFDIELFLRTRREIGFEQYYIQIAELPLNEWKEVKGSKLKLVDFLIAPFEVLKIYRKYK
ncbi:MAG: glycosyltransferase [Bacteroidota bacterium]